MHSIFRSVFWTIVVLLVPTQAMAYLGPGSGSMLLQLLLGGVAGLVVVVKLYWRRLLAFFGLRKNERDTEPSDQG
jgi:hypothetical protein